MKVVVTRAARTDLAEAHDFIALNSHQAAERVLDQLVAVIQQLAAGELKGPRFVSKMGDEYDAGRRRHTESTIEGRLAKP